MADLVVPMINSRIISSVPRKNLWVATSAREALYAGRSPYGLCGQAVLGRPGLDFPRNRDLVLLKGWSPQVLKGSRPSWPNSMRDRSELRLGTTVPSSAGRLGPFFEIVLVINECSFRDGVGPINRPVDARLDEGGQWASSREGKYEPMGEPCNAD